MLGRIEKALLVNHPGYTLTANTFIPDNALAVLAAVLKEDGTDAEIIDYQNAYDIGSILEDEDPKPASALWSAVKSGQPIEESVFGAYREQRDRAAFAFEQRQTERICAKIA